MTPGSSPDLELIGHPFGAEIDREREGWYELGRLVRSLHGRPFKNALSRPQQVIGWRHGLPRGGWCA